MAFALRPLISPRFITPAGFKVSPTQSRDEVSPSHLGSSSRFSCPMNARTYPPQDERCDGNVPSLSEHPRNATQRQVTGPRAPLIASGECEGPAARSGGAGSCRDEATTVELPFSRESVERQPRREHNRAKLPSLVLSRALFVNSPRTRVAFPRYARSGISSDAVSVSSCKQLFFLHHSTPERF